MLKSERKQFAESLTQLFAIYGDDVTPRVLDAWWGVLEPYRLQAVLAAMNLHAGDVKAGMYRPTPAHVRQHLEITMPQMIEERRGAIIRDMRERLSPMKGRIEQLRNDVRIGACEYAVVEQEIDRLNRAMASIIHEPDVQMALAPLPSMIEAEIAPRDRLPNLVRRGIGWLGKNR